MSGIEKKRHNENGYQSVVDFESWRVALLNDDAEYLAAHLDNAQCHLEIDEVFVLLEGGCILLDFGDTEGELEDCAAVVLEAGAIYNVRQGVWHTHALLPGSKVLVVENRETTAANSPILAFSEAQRAEVAKRYGMLWLGQA